MSVCLCVREVRKASIICRETNKRVKVNTKNFLYLSPLQRKQKEKRVVVVKKNQVQTYLLLFLSLIFFFLPFSP